MKTKVLQIDISKAMCICLRSGVKVYPVISGRKFKIEVNDNGKLTRYKKEIDTKALNKALSTTYKHFAVEIMKSKKEKTNA